MAITFTNTSLTPGARQNADLTNELEKLKLQAAIAAAQRGQSTDNSPAALQAARLAAAANQQAAAGSTNKDLQTQRLQVQQALQASQLGAQGGMQTERLQSTEKLTTAQLAAQMARLNTDIAGKKDLQAGDIQGRKELTTLGTDEELRKRKNAATNALALFNATPGTAIGKLNPAAAAAQLA